ncbi:MAG TPA: TIGR04282 family arsenosugar biosynthesis glycosyltransferase [Stellaceae bacterium]|nr:TIGR04282 family arsenosugar biosynthesis glycosyltransferase [Stellaceae bacterium]
MTSATRPDRAFCAIGVMAKAPRAGASKTRLVPPLEPDEAATLSAAFIRDIAANIEAAQREEDIAGYAVYTPLDGEAALREILPADFGLIAPQGNGLGEHLHDSAGKLIAMGHGAACLVNSDSPTLPTAILVEAVRRLRLPGERVVLGPAADGGYYLIGLTRARHRLFEEIDWGSARVFDQTVERARELSLPVEVLPRWYDVDDLPTLELLTRELLGDASAHEYAGGFAAPHTRQFLDSIGAARDLRSRSSSLP